MMAVAAGLAGLSFRTSQGAWCRGEIVPALRPAGVLPAQGIETTRASIKMDPTLSLRVAQR